MLMLAFLIKNINYFVYLWNWFEALSEDPLIATALGHSLQTDVLI